MAAERAGGLGGSGPNASPYLSAKTTRGVIGIPPTPLTGEEQDIPIPIPFESISPDRLFVRCPLPNLTRIVSLDGVPFATPRNPTASEFDGEQDDLPGIFPDEARWTPDGPPHVLRVRGPAGGSLVAGIMGYCVVSDDDLVLRKTIALHAGVTKTWQIDRKRRFRLLPRGLVFSRTTPEDANVQFSGLRLGGVECLVRGSLLPSRMFLGSSVGVDLDMPSGETFAIDLKSDVDAIVTLSLRGRYLETEKA